MKIAGLQKLTLLDFPEKTACTIFTPGCNMRCPFCHNAGLVMGKSPELISVDSVLAFLEKRRGILDGVCISGGEPLLQPDLEDFLRRVRNLGYAVKLDTNGTNPDRLRTLAEQGLLDMVAMDIKNSPEKYRLTAGTERVDVDAINRNIHWLLSQNLLSYEFRTTVVRGYHTAGDFAKIGKWIHGAERYFLQGFVDSGQLISPNVRGCTPAEMQEFLAVVQKDVPNAKIRGID